MNLFIQPFISAIPIMLGFFIICGVVFLKIKYREKTVKLPIDKKQLSRMPGFSLKMKLDDQLLNLMLYILLATLMVSWPFAINNIRHHITNGTIPYFDIAFAAIAVLFLTIKSSKAVTTLTKLRLGYIAELATAGSLIGLQAKGYQIFHDIQADGFNIDHLVVGSNGVFVIETKGRHKRHNDKKKGKKNHLLTFSNNKLHFPSWLETKPIEQAQRQAKWVSHWLTKSTGMSIQPLPILVFPGWYIELKSKPEFPIINHNQLVATIPKLNKFCFSPEQINAISYQVAQRCFQGED